MGWGIKIKMTKYVCTECGKKETIEHVNEIVQPYICLDCTLKNIKRKE